MIGLIDCNNFFVSCERVFNPALAGRPVVVTSHDGGCAVAMSNEAKAIGIKRGVPMFQVRELVRRHNVVTMSGNHRLYGDISARVMAVIAEILPDIEVYSVDEAFIHFPGNDYQDAETAGREIVRQIRRCVGIPTSLGIAPTKTLAKIAAWFAKKYPAYRTVCAIKQDGQRKKALELTDIGDVWGIGRRLSASLRKCGINTAWDFASLSRQEVGRLVNVVGERTWRELNGEPCIDQEILPAGKRQICTSRTFTPSLSTLPELEEAIASFMATASRKLRRQRSAAKGVSVFIHTNTYRTDTPQYYNSAFRTFEEPTNDQMTLIRSSLDALRSIYRKGMLYRRAGVLITETVPLEGVQPSLFLPPEDRVRRMKLNEVVDKLNSESSLNSKIIVAACAPVGGATHSCGLLSGDGQGFITVH